MSFAGLTAGQMLTLFGILGGGMVLLYILKLRRRRVEVPFSPLWTRVVEEKQSSSLFRSLKRFFSLLIQLCLLGLIILALGDPKLSGFAGCSYEAPEPPPMRHTLLVIDASASMSTLERGKTRLERAQAEAHKVVDTVTSNPNHRVMVVQLDATTRPLSLWSGNAKSLHAAIDTVAPGGALDTPTNVDAALALAEDALRSREHGETVLITDRAFAAVDQTRVEALGLKIIGVGEPGVNVGIHAFNVRPYLDDSLSYAIFYGVKNESDAPVKATLFLYANEEGRSVDDFIAPSRIVASFALSLPARGSVDDVIDDVKFEGSRLAARIEIDAADPARDVFPRDDVAFALVPERRVLRVQLVTEGNLFLNATLFVRENVDFVTVTPAEYQGPGDYDLTVVDGAAVDMSKPGDYFVINPQPGGPVEVDGVVKAPEVGRVKKKHPMMRNLTLVDMNVVEMPKIGRAPKDTVLAASTKGAPMLLAREDPVSGRRFVVLAFDVRKSLFPMSYAFPLLIVNVMNHFYQEADGLLQPNRAGVELSLMTELQGRDISVVGPTGDTSVTARRVADRVHLRADRIGIYELSTPTDEIGTAVAVNLMSPAESRVSPQPHEYPAWSAPPLVAVEDDPWLSNIWRLLLLGALALVAIEWLTWHRRVTV